MSVTATTYNGAIPSLPQAINAQIEIFEGQSVLIDLSLQLTLGKIAGVQTIFVDLSKHDGDVFITMLDTLQTICAKAGTQGYYPVLSTSLMKFEVVSNTDGNFPIQFINFPIALGVWGQSGSSATLIENTQLSGISLACEQNPNKLILNKLIAGEGITIDDSCGQIVISANTQIKEQLIYDGEIHTNTGTGTTWTLKGRNLISLEYDYMNTELMSKEQQRDGILTDKTCFLFSKRGVYRLSLEDMVYYNDDLTIDSSYLELETFPYTWSYLAWDLTRTDPALNINFASISISNQLRPQLFNRSIYYFFEQDSPATRANSNLLALNSQQQFTDKSTETTIYKLRIKGRIKIYYSEIPTPTP